MRSIRHAVPALLMLLFRPEPAWVHLHVESAAAGNIDGLTGSQPDRLSAVAMPREPDRDEALAATDEQLLVDAAVLSRSQVDACIGARRVNGQISHTRGRCRGRCLG